MKRYLLDTNVLAIAEQYYSFDLCPSFWDWLNDLNKRERLFSIKKVRQELNDSDKDDSKKRDILLKWLSERESRFYMPIQKETDKQFKAVIAWAFGEQRHTEEAKKYFASGADPYLVAYGAAHGLTVVTQERRIKKEQLENKGNSIGNIKIPYACAAFNVDCINLFEMLKRERITFELKRG